MLGPEKRKAEAPLILVCVRQWNSIIRVTFKNMEVIQSNASRTEWLRISIAEFVIWFSSKCLSDISLRALNDGRTSAPWPRLWLSVWGKSFHLEFKLKIYKHSSTLPVYDIHRRCPQCPPNARRVSYRLLLRDRHCQDLSDVNSILSGQEILLLLIGKFTKTSV